jgi:hypothetical protein
MIKTRETNKETKAADKLAKQATQTGKTDKLATQE